VTDQHTGHPSRTLDPSEAKAGDPGAGGRAGGSGAGPIPLRGPQHGGFTALGPEQSHHAAYPGRPRPGRGSVRRALAAALPPLVLVAAGLVAWQWLVTATGVRPQVLPSPLRVAQQGWAARDALWTNTLPTLHVTAVGFAVSLALGWVIAVAVDFSPWLRRALTPLLVASQTLPIIAIAPLLIIWFGFGLLPKVVVIALVTFFPIVVGLIEGFASTPRAATNLLRSMGASRWQRFRLVRLPQALPSFFTALRIGITYAVTGAVFAEYVGATAGLGIYMSLQKNSFRTDLVLAAVVVTAVLSVALFGLTYAVQRLLIPWYRRG
jgi:ABC-type nitrate/sulfonate/bicarbonate transport system permease component